MQWIVDRIEEGIAVVETDNGCFNLPLWALPEGITEGSVITVKEDVQKRQERKKQIENKMNSLFRD